MISKWLAALRPFKKVYLPYIRVWIALLFLTVTTVVCSHFHLGRLGIWAALSIASIKAGLVLFFFMHMKDEQPIFKYLLPLAFIMLAIFMGLTLFDTAFR